MSVLDLLDSESVWNKFYDYKLSLIGEGLFCNYLRAFIDEKRYRLVSDRIRRGDRFPLPVKSFVSKTGSDKKRVVYTYPEDENTVLKLLTYLILRRYDYLFSPGLYSFRPGRTAKDAVRRLLKYRDIWNMYAYKADIHDYFNSIPVDILLPLLKEKLADDGKLYDFLASLLSETEAIEKGRVICEKKGIMAGTPLSSFYANLFLSEMDGYFYKLGIPYIRYSDDIIVFASSEEELGYHSDHIRSFLADRQLVINEKKEYYYSPGETFEFLGFACSEEKIDISAVTMKKLKAKMRRKRDALSRWAKRNGIPRENAAKAFIRIFDRKLFARPTDNELSWSAWYFSVITTTESLHEIDIYSQDCIRYLLTGSHNKSRFNAKYDDLKALGYKTLVNAYYSYDPEK